MARCDNKGVSSTNGWSRAYAIPNTGKSVSFSSIPRNSTHVPAHDSPRIPVARNVGFDHVLIYMACNDTEEVMDRMYHGRQDIPPRVQGLPGQS